MSTENPKKRLVSWPVYLRMLRDQWILYTFALVSTVMGVLCGLLAVVDFCRNFHLAALPSILFGGGVLILVAYGSVWLGKSLFRVAHESETVVPITRHNTASLPEVETLVRSSDAPPSPPQAELLRAATQGSETPPEELLRATTAGQQVR